MIYLPSKIKYKYVFMVGIILAQLMFMSYVHHHGLYRELPKFTVFDKTKQPGVYKKLINKISTSNFLLLPLEEKCSTYFNELSAMDEHWEISDLDGMDYSMDVLSPHEYYERKYDQLKQEFIKEGRNIDDIDTKEITSDLNFKLSRNKVIEDKIINSVSHLRVYGNCYINPKAKHGYGNCLQIETKLFPWLTFEDPIFERWDGTIVNDYPRLSEYYRYEGEGDLKFKPSHGTCMLSDLKNKFNGKGIVLSIDNHLVDEAVKFLKTLRFLENKLPIQLVHKGELTVESKLKLIELARSNIVVRNARTLYDNRQELWFVDVKRCLQESHIPKFYMYRNKWLAVLFNSFEEMILMDTDVVSFVKPEQYFKFNGYKQTGAFFFKDRETGQESKEAAQDLLLKLMPKDLENLFFDIPKLTDFTLRNKFFSERAYHYMESGVVVINRKTHLLGLLISTQLQFWDPISSHTHGDKELFWLGQSFAGNENYYFNPNPAGAIGRINDREFTVANVIVGTQPAHVGPDNETLLWINSGMETCKKHSWEVDFKENKKISHGFQSEEELKKYYLSPLDIQGVIVPPDASVKYPNDENEPEVGWKQLEFDGCAGYLWGGYSKVGGTTTDNDDSKGLEIRFNLLNISYYSEMGHLWINQDFYYNELNVPSEGKLKKYWMILDKFGSIEAYEKLLNERKKDNDIEEKWDSNEDLKYLASTDSASKPKPPPQDPVPDSGTENV